MSETEGYKEDVLSIPTPRAVHLTDNKYEGTSNPDVGQEAMINVTLDENDYPRQTGHDSVGDDIVLT